MKSKYKHVKVTRNGGLKGVGPDGRTFAFKAPKPGGPAGAEILTEHNGAAPSLEQWAEIVHWLTDTVLPKPEFFMLGDKCPPVDTRLSDCQGDIWQVQADQTLELIRVYSSMEYTEDCLGDRHPWSVVMKCDGPMRLAPKSGRGPVAAWLDPEEMTPAPKGTVLRSEDGDLITVVANGRWHYTGSDYEGSEGGHYGWGDLPEKVIVVGEP